MSKKDYVYVSPIAAEYRYYLDDSVTDSQDYHELYELLANVSENDCVKIIISNFGGSLVTCLAIVNAIRNCAATTVGVLASVAYSAGGAIWLACQHQEVRSHVGFLAHDGQGASFGSLYQQKISIEHEMVMLRSLYEDVYRHFLTEEEIEAVLRNGDLWLNEKEICKRLDQRQKLLQETQLSSQQQLQEIFDELDSMSKLPDWILDKVTKKDLLAYLNGDVDFEIDEENKRIKLIKDQGE
jgi:ATP-dependent protease ClpP protease subunit